MTIDENNFAVALRDLADRDPVTSPPTAQVLGRARRARRGRTAAMTAAALAVVTMAGGGLAIGLDRRSPAILTATAPTAKATSPAADSPALQLVAAVQASAETSFRFTMTTGGTYVEYGKKKTMRQGLVTGAYDPRAPRGYSTQVGAPMDRRLIGKDLYLQKGERWMKLPASYQDVLAGDLLYTDVLNPMATVDFANQVAALKKTGAVKKTSATSYTFSFSWKPGDPDRPDVIPISGTIQIDAKSRRVTAMAYNCTLAYPKGEADAKFYYSLHWAYSGYGEPVDVQAPPVAPRPPRREVATPARGGRGRTCDGTQPCHWRQRAAYRPSRVIRSSWVPSSMIRPASITAIRSASWAVCSAGYLDPVAAGTGRCTPWLGLVCPGHGAPGRRVGGPGATRACCRR